MTLRLLLPQNAEKNSRALHPATWLLQAILFLELINPTGSIDYPALVSGIKGVALGANFHLDCLLGGTHLKLVSTRTMGGYGDILGMNLVLQCFHLTLSASIY